MSDIAVGVEDKMASVILQDIYCASFHLDHHVSKDGTIVELDPNCEYCQIYIEEQRILL